MVWGGTSPLFIEMALWYAFSLLIIFYLIGCRCVTQECPVKWLRWNVLEFRVSDGREWHGGALDITGCGSALWYRALLPITFRFVCFFELLLLMILAEAFQYLAEFLVVWLTGKSHPLDLLCENLEPVGLPAGVLAHLTEAVAFLVAFQELQHLLTTRLLLV